MRRAIVAALLATWACSPKAASAPDSLRPPLTASVLVDGHFVVYTLLWQVAVPGGDPIVFLADGTTKNMRAGLAGRWTIVDDSTLAIQPEVASAPPGLAGPPVTFRLRASRGALISPVRSDSAGDPVYQIRRAGSTGPGSP
jgi:hypothetical protein